MPSVLSVHVGLPGQVSWTRSRRTSIVKTSVTGPVEVGEEGLAGDRPSNRAHHGGPDKAVYAFAREDLDHWAGVLGAAVPDGLFGENLTTRGIDVNAAEVGERWRIGTTVLEVCSVRTPCATFRTWMGRNGHDNRGWLKRFVEVGRPGPYLRVVTPGRLAAGDSLEVVRRPGHGVTVATMFRALMTEPDLLPLLLQVEDLVPQARARVHRHLEEVGETS